MICKYCGKESDNGSEICSVCRDMLGVDEPDNADISMEEVSTPEHQETFVPPSKEKKAKKAGKEKGSEVPRKPKDPQEKKDLVPMIAVILCALCLIVAVFSLYNAAKMRAELGETMAFQLKTVQEKNEDLEKRLAVFEQKAAAEEEARKAAEEEAKRNFKISSAPSDEQRELGYRSQTDHYLFGFIVEGSAESFTWEKQLADGSWIPVVFDENNKNADFGISKLENLKDGYSKLVAEGLTIQAAGTYRCTAKGSYGGNLQAEVKLEVTR